VALGGGDVQQRVGSRVVHLLPDGVVEAQQLKETFPPKLSQRKKFLVIM
jgi:hypothetical protein